MDRFRGQWKHFTSEITTLMHSSRPVKITSFATNTGSSKNPFTLMPNTSVLGRCLYVGSPVSTKTTSSSHDKRKKCTATDIHCILSYRKKYETASENGYRSMLPVIL